MTRTVAEPVSDDLLRGGGPVHIRVKDSQPLVAFCGLRLTTRGQIPQAESTPGAYCRDCVKEWERSLDQAAGG